MKIIFNPIEGKFNIVPDSGTYVQKINPFTGEFNLTIESNSYTQKFNPIEGEFNLWVDDGIKTVTGNGYIDVTDAVAGAIIELKVYGGISQIIPPNTQGPCPNGYHIPSSEENTAIIDAMTALGIDTTNGACMKTYLKMPYAGYRNQANGNTAAQGTAGRYWSYLRLNANTASILAFQSNTNGNNNANAAYGMSIRPFKNEAVIPDNAWTTLFDGSSIATNAGIFHNATDGIISISADGINWITIADKNLGATVVYNDGDTLSESNTGGYFQHGNNYMFPFTGSVTTSSTKVDTTGYGPGNYYSSSTFIAVSGDWSSVYNSNLWGGNPTPSPSRPAQLICNNGILKIDGQGQIYADGTIETIEDELSNTATAEMLLAIGDIKDEQEILSGTIIRKCGICVYDGTQTIGNTYISNTGGLDNGAIIIYQLTTPTTETVEGQSLELVDGVNHIEIVEASIDNLPLKLKYATQ